MNYMTISIIAWPKIGTIVEKEFLSYLDVLGYPQESEDDSKIVRPEWWLTSLECNSVFSIYPQGYVDICQ